MVDNKCGTATEELKLWIIEFDIIGSNNKGCAVVKANNPHQAEILLRTEGISNGNPGKYCITRIAEIIPSPEAMLICEQWAHPVDDY